MIGHIENGEEKEPLGAIIKIILKIKDYVLNLLSKIPFLENIKTFFENNMAKVLNKIGLNLEDIKNIFDKFIKKSIISSICSVIYENRTKIVIGVVSGVLSTLCKKGANALLKRIGKLRQIGKALKGGGIVFSALSILYDIYTVVEARSRMSTKVIAIKSTLTFVNVGATVATFFGPIGLIVGLSVIGAVTIGDFILESFIPSTAINRLDINIQL